MKPHRIRMTHNLLVNYGVYKKLQVFVPNLHCRYILILLTLCVVETTEGRTRGLCPIPC